MSFVNTSSGVSTDIRINSGAQQTILECTVRQVAADGKKSSVAEAKPSNVSTSPAPAPAPAAPKAADKPADKPKTADKPKSSSPKKDKKPSPVRNACSDAKIDGLHFSRVLDVGSVVTKKGQVIGSGRPICALPRSRSGMCLC